MVASCKADWFSFQRATKVCNNLGTIGIYETNASCLNTGVIASPTDRLVPAANRAGNMEDELPKEPVKILETQATFDNFVVWGHEISPAADDTFVKGVDEWIKLAEAVCNYNPCSLDRY